MTGPVGFFDSGVGGLCILEAFRKLCPGVETVYVADSEHCPYGNRSREEIIRLSEACVRKLLAQNCQLIVVACNTATAAAIDYLRTNYPEVPFVGLEPAIKPAALKSQTGIVGVLATQGTFNGRLYNETKMKFAKNVTILATVADEFVEIVERLHSNHPPSETEIRKAVEAKVEPLLRAGADKIVLGCTHFPHLRTYIEQLADGRAEVVDSCDAVARQIHRVLRGLKRVSHL